VSMTSPTNHVEIITSVQRRRRWTASEKVRMVEETFEPGMTVSLVARRRGVAPNQLSATGVFTPSSSARRWLRA
jgi:transposase